ncbi:MAG: hypothetical protein PF637_13240 [Spirochaetes bacterium]|jgi:hypothetical protein|nr:hypothetical protein [Spirochaetota bacterium]
MKKIRIFTLVITFLCFGSHLFADGLSTSDFNHINDLIGGRAIGLGGAYCAISDDPAGAYYNPAGLVYAINNQISLSVNSYKSRQSEFKKVIGDNDYSQEVSSFYPSFFGVAQSFGSVKIGFTFVNINNEILDQDSHFNDLTYTINETKAPATFTMNYNITENTLLGGPSVAFFAMDNLSFGLTLYAMKRSKQEIAFQMVTFEYNGAQYYSITNTYITEDIYALKPVLGTQYMPNKFFALGLSVMPGFVLSHKKDVQVFDKSVDAGIDMNETDGEGNPLANLNKASKDYSDSSLPTQIRLGVAYYPSNRFLLTADLIAHVGSKNLQNDMESTLNIAIGAEYYLTDSFPFRFGIFTNFANTPEIDDSKTGQEAHVNLLGFSSSISWQTRNSSITLAGFYQTSDLFGWSPLGDGEAQVYSGQASVQEMQMSLYSISLTGSAKY